jgi:hypothetical protein
LLLTKIIRERPLIVPVTHTETILGRLLPTFIY